MNLDSCTSHFLKEINVWTLLVLSFVEILSGVWSSGSYHHQWFYECAKSHFQGPHERKANMIAFLLFKDEGSEIKEPEWRGHIPADSARCHLLIRLLGSSWGEGQTPATSPSASRARFTGTFWSIYEWFYDSNSQCSFHDSSLFLWLLSFLLMLLFQSIKPYFSRELLNKRQES